MRQTIINTYLQTIGKTWEQVSSYERTVLSSFADELERKLTPTKKGVQFMSKNTTDLKLKIEHYLVSTQQDGAGIAMGRRSADGSLYKSRIDEFTEAIMSEIEQLISNREKLARIDELERLQTLGEIRIRSKQPGYPIGILDCSVRIEQLKETLPTLRKELDEEEPTNE